MEIVLLWGTQNDLLKAYESHGEPLHDKVEAALSLIQRNPDIAPRYRGTYYRKVVLKTYYALYYTIEGNRIIVGAFLDQRQDPWQFDKRLGIS